METTTPPPSELPFGARVRAVFTKYDETPHWEYDLVVLGVDEYGVWVGGAPGGYIARPGREFTSDAHWVCLYPHAGAWVATINDNAGTFSSRIYVDVTTPPAWWHRPDGILSVSCVDLDLDVIKKFTGEVFVDDEDEFAEHQVEWDYPREIVESAERTCDWLFHHIRRLDEPFDAVAESWLEVCRAHVVSDDRGRAVMRPGGSVPERVETHPSQTAAPYGTLPDRPATPAPEPAEAPQPEEEDFLAVWSDDAPRPILEDADVVDDGPVVEVDHTEHDRLAPEGEDIAADFEDVDGIDTAPVDPNEVTGVLLTTESGRQSPLWFDGRPVEPDELGLPIDLTDHLYDWSDRWNRDFDPDRGWHPHARIGDYEALGAWLGRRVKDALGGTTVLVQPAHLGRSGLAEVPSADQRAPLVVELDPIAPGDFPVRGDIVTLQGTVGCFSSETNARLTEWAAAGAPEGPEVEGLRRLMADELGPDYEVH